MRAGQNEATGTSGESEVLAEFERLGWAGLLDSRHDVGTDLYLRPRDDRRFELGAVMGAQVKTGPSYFRNLSRSSEGDIEGWWFKDSNREHIDYWLRHALPHILILRDQQANVSYWVHVTPEAVVPTRSGAKILVPKSQIVGSAQHLVLADIALSHRSMPLWDGSAWTGATNLSKADQIRYALIAPRLVAPHPNSAPTTISGIEALAMQILIRDELDMTFSRDELAVTGRDGRWEGISLQEARLSDDWAWRATAAVRRWVYDDEEEDLWALKSAPDDPTERAASAVLNFVAHMDAGEADKALEIVLEALEADDYGPVDYAWLQSQRARALLEVGRQEEAFDLAMKYQRIHRQEPHDVTAAAISGGCALVAFRAVGWMQGDIGDFIQRNDNPASWWRSQILSYGLAAHLEESYETWAGHVAGGGRDDQARRRLRSAALLASCAADQRGWQNAQALLAQHVLAASARGAESGDVAAQLTCLRLAGDEKSLGRALRRIVNEGPAQAIEIASRGIDPRRSTRTTALADLEFYIRSRDTVPTAEADRVSAWALETLSRPETYCTRTTPTYVVRYKIYEVLAAIIWALSEEASKAVTNYLLLMPAVTDDANAQFLARLVRALPDHAWTDADRQRAGRRAEADARYLREAYLGAASAHVEQSRDQIFGRASRGDLQVLDAIHDIRALPPHAVKGLALRSEESIIELLDAARHGSFSIGGVDAAHALTIINVWHAGHARWTQLKLLLASPTARPSQKSGVLDVLSRQGDSLDDSLRRELLPLAAGLRESPSGGFSMFDRVDIRGLAAETVAALSTQEDRQGIVRELLAGDDVLRTSAVRIVERFLCNSFYIDLLLAMSDDSASNVRKAAAGALSKMVALGDDTRELMIVLVRMLHESGRDIALEIISRLASTVQQNDGVRELLQLGKSHPSARVRREALALLPEHLG